MEVTQDKWNSIFHNRKEPWNCSDGKKKVGCKECDFIKEHGIDTKNNSFILSVIGDVHANIKALRAHASKNLHSVLAVGDLCIYTTEDEAKKDKQSYTKNTKAINSFIAEVSNKQIQPFTVPVKSILGNHDNFINLHNEVYDQLKLSYVENGTVLKIGNMVIATLGGIFSPKKISWKTSALHEYNKRFFTQEDIDKLLAAVEDLDVDVLITHQAPAEVLPTMASNVDEGSLHLTKLLKEINPRYLIHGHHHTEYQTMYNDTQVFGLGNFKLNNNTFINFNILTGEVIYQNN